MYVPPPEVGINWIAILVADLIYMVIGAMWYGPLFGSRWIKEHKWSSEDMVKMKAQSKSMSQLLATGFVAGLVMMFVLKYAVTYAGAVTAYQGATVGFMCWLGFIAVTFLNSVLYERKPSALYIIDNGYYLVSLILTGALLAVWI